MEGKYYTAVLAVLGVFFIITGSYLMAPTHQTTEIESHSLLIHPSPLADSAIPDEADVVPYFSLSESETEIADSFLQNKHTSLKTYEYPRNQSTKPAATFASHDYLQYNGVYYPIVSSTESNTIASPGTMKLVPLGFMLLLIGVLTILIAALVIPVVDKGS